MSKNDYKCPITLESFKEPIFLVNDGFTYEKEHLYKWLSLNNTSPMGFSITDSITIIPNKNFRHDEPYICPITKEEMKDPILLPSGYTYEHKALLKAIKNTICKGKPLFLNGYKFSEIKNVYSNKIFWKSEYSKYRKIFVIPDIKKYPGINREILTNRENPIKIIGNAFEYYDKIIKNKYYLSSYFTGGCFKGCNFKNCEFENCIFSDVCFCSKFKNCAFYSCSFIRTSMKLERTQLPGCIFSKCYVIQPTYKDFFKKIKYKCVLESDIIFYEK
jgi:hypothetical protein